mgnify:CR=1 FL=1
MKDKWLLREAIALCSGRGEHYMILVILRINSNRTNISPAPTGSVISSYILKLFKQRSTVITCIAEDFAGYSDPEIETAFEIYVLFMRYFQVPLPSDDYPNREITEKHLFELTQKNQRA